MYFKSAATTVLMAGLLFPGVLSTSLLPRINWGTCQQTSPDTCGGNGLCHFGDGSSVCCGENSKGRACGAADNGCKEIHFFKDIVNCD
ncbi:hypothetical protein F4821DRAFT_258913 [Hypoxylon rubiginosum]|uniref:Uncharacterized protein n=1 Tax=Hypoxylon rubiginosum TaxID=110542 RepID=A0ACC0D4I3_9PEZI|nr:hypothetical protein F4821DRAFT_258913 [Hypoxylon rubiginosum]